MGEDAFQATAEAEALAPEPDMDAELALQVWSLALARVFRSGRFAPNTMAAPAAK